MDREYVFSISLTRPISSHWDAVPVEIAEIVQALRQRPLPRCAFAGEALMAHERLSDSRDAASFLVCRSNSCLCALPLISVAETMRPLAIEPLAAMPPFLLGVSVIRSAPVPIVDTAKLLGSTTPTRPQRIVTVKIGDRLVGLAVESVLGVRAIPLASLNEVPPLLHQVGDDTVSAITRLDAELLLVLESARIVPESVWAAIDSAGSAI